MEEYRGKLGHCCGFLNLGNVVALVLITNQTQLAHEMEAFIPQYYHSRSHWIAPKNGRFSYQVVYK